MNLWLLLPNVLKEIGAREKTEVGDAGISPAIRLMGRSNRLLLLPLHGQCTPYLKSCQ